MKIVISTSIIALSIILVSIIFANTYKGRNKNNDIINVTGLGSKDFNSDLIVWNGYFTKKNIDLKKCYEELNKDRESIKQYLISKNIKETEIIFEAIILVRDINDYYDKDNIRHTDFIGYTLSQNVKIESTEVDKVELVSREITELINTGVEFYSYPPEYYYTKLAELKIEMISTATKDAKTRAEKIAENANAKLGKLKYASMGIFQITAQNSAETYSWGGVFNTTSKRKTANITMKLQYEIE